MGVNLDVFHFIAHCFSTMEQSMLIPQRKANSYAKIGCEIRSFYINVAKNCSHNILLNIILHTTTCTNLKLHTPTHPNFNFPSTCNCPSPRFFCPTRHLLKKLPGNLQSGHYFIPGFLHQSTIKFHDFSMTKSSKSMT